MGHPESSARWRLSLFCLLAFYSSGSALAAIEPLHCLSGLDRRLLACWPGTEPESRSGLYLQGLILPWACSGSFLASILLLNTLKHFQAQLPRFALALPPSIRDRRNAGDHHCCFSAALSRAPPGLALPPAMAPVLLPLAFRYACCGMACCAKARPFSLCAVRDPHSGGCDHRTLICVWCYRRASCRPGSSWDCLLMRIKLPKWRIHSPPLSGTVMPLIMV